jgi:hypothetical protein
LLIGMGRNLTGRLLLLDALTMEWRSVRLTKDPHCAVCGARSVPPGASDSVIR